MSKIIENLNNMLEKNLDLDLNRIQSSINNASIEPSKKVIEDVYSQNIIASPKLNTLNFFKLMSHMTGTPISEYLNSLRDKDNEIDLSIFSLNEQEEIESILLSVEVSEDVEGVLELPIEDIEILDLLYLHQVFLYPL